MDQQKVDTAALDYGQLLAESKKVADRTAAMNLELKAMEDRKALLAGEIAENEAAKSRVRDELLQIERDRETAKKVKEDQLENESRVIETQRGQVEVAKKQVQDATETLEKRVAAVEGRENAVSLAERQLESKNRAIATSESNLVAKETEIKVQADLLSKKEREVKDREDAAALKEKATQEQHDSNKRMHSEAVVYAEKADKDAKKAAYDLTEIRVLAEKNQETLKELKIFCDVAHETQKFILDHTGQDDQIRNFINTQFPLASEAMHKSA